MRGEGGLCNRLAPKYPIPDYLRNIHRCRFVNVIPYSLGKLISSKQGKWHRDFRNDIWNKNAKKESFSFGLQFGMSFPIFSPNESTKKTTLCKSKAPNTAKKTSATGEEEQSLATLTVELLSGRPSLPNYTDQKLDNTFYCSNLYCFLAFKK